MREKTVVEDRIAGLLADAAEFFEAYLWEVESSEAGRKALSGHGLAEDVIRDFGVGYAPVGPDELMEHMRKLGYSTEELVTAGLVHLSVRGRAHAHFRSRLMFPVKDAEGRTLGFAALGTHVGPSWALWVTSSDTGLYRRSEAVYGLDLAAEQIAATGTAVVCRDCIEVLRAHQEGETNAVTVHSGAITRDQLEALAAGVPGGAEGLTLELPSGMEVEVEPEPATSEPADGRPITVRPSAEPPSHLGLKRTLLVIATAILAINAWTGAPLLAVWVGSQAQGGRVLSTRGVLTVLVVLSVLVFLIGWALTWLSAKYDELSGRPRLAGLTSPWHRAKRGDRVQDIRSRYGISAPEKAVAACVIAGVLAFELWFFFFAGSSLPHP
jgi:DNA primase catalytic core, N-terminal domain